jgi:hypothetical protein
MLWHFHFTRIYKDYEFAHSIRLTTGKNPEIQIQKIWTILECLWANRCVCYDSHRTVDITHRSGMLFIFSIACFDWTFHDMFHPLFHPSVLHVVLLPAYIHSIVSSNNVFTPIYLALYAGFSNVFHIYLNEDYRYTNYNS